MVFGFSRVKPSPIAVDFGADSLKLLQIVPGDPPQLVAATTEMLPEEARQNPTARYAYFAHALRTLYKQGGFKGNRALLSIPAYQTLITHLQVPNSDEDDLETQIGLHLRQRLNVNPDRMVMRHEIVPGVHNGKQEIICMAASKESVMHYVQIAQQAKIDVVGMHAEPQAIVKAFEHLHRGTDACDRTTCFIDLGGATTKVVITHGNHMVFAKAIHVAGDHLTRHVAEAESQTFMDARTARWQGDAGDAWQNPAEDEDDVEVLVEPTGTGQGGLAAMEAQIAAEQKRATGAPTPPRKPARQLHAAVSDTLDCLIDELQMCVRYHTTLFPTRQIERLVFVGGESHHTDICQRIARSLRIGAQLGDPFARLNKTNAAKATPGLNLTEQQPGWAVPLGLCLCEAAL